MATPDPLRYRKIPLTHGSGAMPALGFGTLIPDPLATVQATKAALEAGFRHFDCAERYRNEHAAGDAMKELFGTGRIKREDVFVTTKLWNNNHRPERVKPAFEASRQRLQLDYVDCYLIHTPFAFQPGDEQDPRDGQGQPIYDPGVTLIETWSAFENLVDEGRCKSIGLSDVSLEQVQEIFEAARIKPAVVQVESHPYLPQCDLLDYCRQHGIAMLAFAALGHGMEPKLLENPVITAIAQRVHKTPAKLHLPGRYSAAQPSSRHRPNPAKSRRTLTSQPCPKTPCRRFGIKSRRGCGSILLWGPACLGLFPKEGESDRRRLAAACRVEEWTACSASGPQIAHLTRIKSR